MTRTVRGQKGATVRQGRSFVDRRRAEIVGVLRDEGRVVVSELAQRFGVSPLTIRRDISYLESKGIVERRYGEAILAESPSLLPELAEAPLLGGKHPEASPTSRVERSKLAIARAAASLLNDGATTFVNTSTTALLSIEQIHQQNITVITNSARANDLPLLTHVTILVTGGEVSMPRGTLSGEFALSNLRSVVADWSFMGCAGISPLAGVTSTTLQEATVNSLMLERANTGVLLADSTKLGHEGGFCYASLSDFDLLITDVGASPEQLDALRRAGLKSIAVVDPDDPLAWNLR